MKKAGCVFFFLFFVFVRSGYAQVAAQKSGTVREVQIFETVFTVPQSFHSDTVSGKRVDFISGKDTIRVTRMDYYNAGDDTSGVMRTYVDREGDTLHALSTFNDALKYDYMPVPFDWLSAITWGGQSLLPRMKTQMSHPTKAQLDSFPLLKTHKAQVVTNKLPGGDELIIVLTPLANQPGKIYVLQAYDCYKGMDFVFFETAYSDAAAQKRYMEIFRTIRAR